MKKTFEAKVVSLKMNDTAVVEITRKTAHPLYKKLLKRSRKFKAEIGKFELKLGDRVKIEETRPISKDKNFKITEVIK